MREILFRGQTKKTKLWILGLPFYLADGLIAGIETNDGLAMEVIPETISQFIGQTDKNGRKIFEGDIIKDCGGTLGVVKFGEGTFDSGIYKYTGYYYQERNGNIDRNALYQTTENWEQVQVIGDIYDNPELLEVDE